MGDRLHEILKHYPNGEERYKTNAFFANLIQFVSPEADEMTHKLINNLFEQIDTLQESNLELLKNKPIQTVIKCDKKDCVLKQINPHQR